MFQRFKCFAQRNPQCRLSNDGTYKTHHDCMLHCIETSQQQGLLTNRTHIINSILKEYEEALRYAKRFDVTASVPAELQARILTMLTSCDDVLSYDTVHSVQLSDMIWQELNSAFGFGKTPTNGSAKGHFISMCRERSLENHCWTYHYDDDFAIYEDIQNPGDRLACMSVAPKRNDLLKFPDKRIVSHTMEGHRTDGRVGRLLKSKQKSQHTWLDIE